MNRLWVRLSLAFGAIVAIGFGAVAFSAQGYFSDSNLRGVIAGQFTRPTGLRDQLADYYTRTGSWQGVETLMTGADSALFFGPSRGLSLILTDPEGRVLYSSRGRVPPRLDRRRLRQAQPIEVDGQTVGFLDLSSEFAPGNPRPDPPGAGPPDFVEQISGFLLQISLLGGLLAIVFGVAVSRWLAGPLGHLVAGTQAIARRNLRVRVAERGSAETRELARSFNGMAAALEEAEALRQNLLADVAHELRTPLTVLQGNLRAILDGVYPLEQAEIARLLAQTEHLQRLVADLRLLAQAEARQLPLQRAGVDLAGLLAETAELFRPLAREQEISLETDLPPGGVTGLVDRARLAQALQNLVQNGLAHTPAGGWVRLSLRAGGGTATLAVTDSGAGIAAADIPRIFDRFYRVDAARSRETGGAGLGLAIVRALVEAHGGSVAVESRGVGQGSRFVVHLPVE